MQHEINLFDPSLRKPLVLLPSRQMLVGWVAVTVALLAAWGWLALERSKADRELRRMNAETNALKDDVKRLAGEVAARRPSAEMQLTLERRQAEQHHRQRVLDHLRSADLGSTAGYSTLLQALARQVPEGLWLTGVTIAAAGQDIRLEGRTLEPALVARYLADLGSEASLKGHAFNTLEFRHGTAAATPAGGDRREAPEGVVEFSVASRSEMPAARSGAPR